MSLLKVRSVIEITPAAGGKADLWDSAKEPSLFNRVSVELTTGQASEAQWAVADPDGRMLNRYSKADGIPNATIRVWLGYGQQLGEPVFKGMLVRVQRGGAITTFRAYDMGYKMRQVARTAYHKGRDLDIMRGLVERSGLKFEGPEAGFPSVTHGSMIQDGGTDWDHLGELAREAGLVRYVRGDTVFLKEPNTRGKKSKFTLEFGKTALLSRDTDLSFKLPENREGKARQVAARGRGHGGKRLEAKSDVSERGVEQLLMKRDLKPHTLEAARRRAQAVRQLEREHAFECRVQSMQPLSANYADRADVRDTITLRGPYLLFGGDYIVDSVSYEVTSRGFHTTYALQRDIAEG
jgi:phage protein D